MTIAVPNNFKNKDGSRGSQFPSVEAFVSSKANGLGVYAYIHKGDLISVSGTIRTNTFTDKNGETQYTQVLNVDDVVLQESRKTTTERQNSRAQGEAAEGAEGAEPAPAAETGDGPVEGPVATGDDPFDGDAPFGE